MDGILIYRHPRNKHTSIYRFIRCHRGYRLHRFILYTGLSRRLSSTLLPLRISTSVYTRIDTPRTFSEQCVARDRRYANISVQIVIIITILFARTFKCHCNNINSQLEMWANAQRDGRPAEYRWRPLFNAAKFR